MVVYLLVIFQGLSDPNWSNFTPLRPVSLQTGTTRRISGAKRFDHFLVTWDGLMLTSTDDSLQSIVCCTSSSVHLPRPLFYPNQLFSQVDVFFKSMYLQTPMSLFIETHCNSQITVFLSKFLGHCWFTLIHCELIPISQLSPFFYSYFFVFLKSLFSKVLAHPKSQFFSQKVWVFSTHCFSSQIIIFHH